MTGPEKTELTIRGVYFESKYGEYTESHSGTPGIELTVNDQRVFISHANVSLIAKTIERLGCSGRNSVTVSCYRAHA